MIRSTLLILKIIIRCNTVVCASACSQLRYEQQGIAQQPSCQHLMSCQCRNLQAECTVGYAIYYGMHDPHVG